jgi:hypothetical protein
MSSTTGSLSQVRALVAPEPGGDVDRVDDRVGVEEVLHPVGPRRTVMNGSTMAIRPWRARALTAVPLASSVDAVPGSSSAMRVSIFPPSSPLAAMVSAS